VLILDQCSFHNPAHHPAVKTWLQAYPDRVALARALLDDTIAPIDTHRLTALVLDAAAHVAGWMTHRRGYTFVKMGLSRHDIACDVVAELLAAHDHKPLGRFRLALERFAGVTDDPAAFDAALMQILTVTVDQNLTRLFREFDPVYARALRMLRLHVREHPDAVRIERDLAGTVYVAANAPYDRERAVVPLEALETMLHVQSLEGNPAVVVLETCLRMLAAHPLYRCAVHEADVMRLTIDLLGRSYTSDVIDEQDAGGAHDHALLMADIKRAIEMTRVWIESSYVARRKLSPPESTALLDALRAYVADIGNNDERPRISYLQKVMPELTYDLFRSRYRNLFDYMIRVFFTNARTVLVFHGHTDNEHLMQGERHG
jgi:hypothetical protein